MTEHDADKNSGHGKDSDMKMRLVPSEATEEMWLATLHIPFDMGFTESQKIRCQRMLDAAPHAGKVSAEMLEAAGKAAFTASLLPNTSSEIIARAVLEAIGLEVEG